MEGSKDGRVMSSSVAGVVREQPHKSPRTRFTPAHEWTTLIPMAGCILGIGEASTSVGGVEAARVVGRVAGVQGEGGHRQVMQELTLASHTFICACPAGHHTLGNVLWGCVRHTHRLSVCPQHQRLVQA